MAFYQAAAPTLKHGRSVLRDSGIGNRRHSKGWQTVLRVRDDGQQALVVAHTFDTPGATDLVVNLPAGAWDVADAFHTDAVTARLDGQRLLITVRPAYAGLGVLLHRHAPTAKAQT